MSSRIASASPSKSPHPLPHGWANLVVAAVQGALGGLAFWLLDIRGALLWAVLMAFLSLLPAVGAGLVWLPVATYLLITGALWQGIALIAYGVLVIGLVDNALRPALVGKDTRMPDYVVMITTLGGMAVFGVNGFVLGPVIAAMFMAVWHIHVGQHTARRDPIAAWRWRESTACSGQPPVAPTPLLPRPT